MKVLLEVVSVVLLCSSLVRSFEDKTVYQYLVDNGYTSFAQLLQQAKVDVLLDSAGPFTVFAPTNEAILKVDPDTMVSLSNNPIQLQQLLKYHVVNGFRLSPQIHGSETITTQDGQAINVTHASVSSGLILNGVVKVIAPNDVICNNGLIHTIDTVLQPPVFGTNSIAGVLLMRDDLFRDTTLAFLLSGLSSLLESGEYTLFAPIDSAWAPFSQSILHPNIPNANAVYEEILKYHMVPGSRTKSMLKDGDQLFTLHGTPVNITKGVSRLSVNYATVTDYDIPATNGVVHAIDGLLIPADLLHKLQMDYAQG